MTKPRLLFVYGTLRPASKSVVGLGYRRRLARESRFVGAACMDGKLYDLGAYPGFVDHAAAGGQAIVHGDLVALGEPARTFRWLDPYEDVVPGRCVTTYVRCVRTARLADGVEAACWVYVYRGSLVRARFVRSGHWHR